MVFSSGYSFFLAWRLWHFQTLVHLRHISVLRNVMWIISCKTVFLWHRRQKQWDTDSWLVLFDRCMTAHLNPGFTSYQCDSRGNWANTGVGRDDITSRREETVTCSDSWWAKTYFQQWKEDWCKYTLIKQCRTLCLVWGRTNWVSAYDSENLCKLTAVLTWINSLLIRVQ